MLPALAVADALRSRGVSVTFAGSPDRAEARLVPEAGYELDPFRVVGFPRRPGVGARARAASRPAAPCARRAASSSGAGPTSCSAAAASSPGRWSSPPARRRIPAALTEADAHLGLANRLAAPFARRVFLTFPIEGRDPPKYRVTGRPLPARSAPVPREEARRRFDLPQDGPVLLVFGGSGGAAALNEFAVEAFGRAGPGRPAPRAASATTRSCAARVERPDYRLLPFTDDFGAALAAADLALARAGGSVWELAAAGLPAVLVPSPNVTADHQTKNARHFERGGGAVVLPEPELAARGRDVVESLLADDERRARMGEAMRRLARPDAADAIAEELIELAEAARR